MFLGAEAAPVCVGWAAGAGGALSLEHPRFANAKTNTSKKLRFAYETTGQAP